MGWAVAVIVGEGGGDVTGTVVGWGVWLGLGVVVAAWPLQAVTSSTMIVKLYSNFCIFSSYAISQSWLTTHILLSWVHEAAVEVQATSAEACCSRGKFCFSPHT